MSALVRSLRLAAALFALAATGALAGGPMSICDDAGKTPLAYSPPTVNLNYDLGSLGTRTKAQADAIVTNAVALWTNVGTATITIGRGADLPVDVDSAATGLTSYTNYLSNFSDGLNPVVYDTDGSLTDLLLYAGAKNSVLGFAGSAYYLSPTCRYAEGQAVISGFLAVDDTTLSNVITHEIGHLIGLDHTQLDSDQGLTPTPPSNYPMMYPVAYRGTTTLHEDDVAAVSALYPDATLSSVYGQLSGTFVLADGVSPVLGANLWAQETTTHNLYSIVSDYLTQGTGYFKLLLPPGTYNLRAGAIHAGFDGGSSVGPYSETPTSPSFVSPLYSGSTPMATVTLGNSSPTAILITAGCAATVTFRMDGTGAVGGNCMSGPPAAPLMGTATAGPGQVSVTFTPGQPQRRHAHQPPGDLRRRDGSRVQRYRHVIADRRDRPHERNGLSLLGAHDHEPGHECVVGRFELGHADQRSARCAGHGHGNRGSWPGQCHLHSRKPERRHAHQPSRDLRRLFRSGVRRLWHDCRRSSSWASRAARPIDAGRNTITNMGTSPWSGASNWATPTNGPPAAPMMGMATAGPAQVTVTFTPGSLNGGTLTTHQVTCAGATGASYDGYGMGSPIVVMGLASGTQYRCWARTMTSLGTGAWSGASNWATPTNGPPASPDHAHGDRGLRPGHRQLHGRQPERRHAHDVPGGLRRRRRDRIQRLRHGFADRRAGPRERDGLSLLGARDDEPRHGRVVRCVQLGDTDRRAAGLADHGDGHTWQPAADRQLHAGQPEWRHTGQSPGDLHRRHGPGIQRNGHGLADRRDGTDGRHVLSLLGTHHLQPGDGCVVRRIELGDAHTMRPAALDRRPRMWCMASFSCRMASSRLSRDQAPRIRQRGFRSASGRERTSSRCRSRPDESGPASVAVGAPSGCAVGGTSAWRSSRRRGKPLASKYGVE